VFISDLSVNRHSIEDPNYVNWTNNWYRNESGFVCRFTWLEKGSSLKCVLFVQILGANPIISEIKMKLSKIKITFLKSKNGNFVNNKNFIFYSSK